MLFATIALFALAGDASGEGADWLIADDRLGTYPGLGELGEVRVERVSLSLFDRSARRPSLGSGERHPRRGHPQEEICLLDSYLEVMPDLRGVPDWQLSELGDCGPAKSSLDGLVPRLSIQGTFFRIGYGVELDKESRGLLIDYGGFTVGIGDSPSGAALFSGASFGLPRWLPGRSALPDPIRENVRFDLGLLLNFDTLDIREWSPTVGIGVELLEW